MKKHLFMLCAWVTLFLGVAIEEKLMETPMENTVTDFELAEDGFSVVLTNAIKDARAVVDYMQERQEVLGRCRMQAQTVGNDAVCEGFNQKCVEADQVMFQAMRVLGLLEATREREAGQVT